MTKATAVEGIRAFVETDEGTGFISSGVLGLSGVAGAASEPVLFSGPCAAPALGHVQICPRP